jgi:hypothetical protein
MYTLFLKKKSSQKHFGTSLIPILKVTTEIWAVVCECGGITWSTLKSDFNLNTSGTRWQRDSQQGHIFSDY